MTQELTKEVAQILIAIPNMELDKEDFLTEAEKELKQAWYKLWVATGQPDRNSLDEAIKES